jgi:hypothetical protein
MSMPRARHLLQLALLAVPLLCWAAPAQAITVVLVQPEATSPVLGETLVRLHGELLALDITVDLVESPGQPDGNERYPWPWLNRVATERRAAAVITITGEPARLRVEVWLTESPRADQATSRSATEPNTPGASERLAIRAIEILRSSFLVIDLAAKRLQGESRHQAQTQSIVASPDLGPPSRPPALGIELGAAVLASLDGLGPAFLPFARLDWAARPSLIVQVAMAGFGTRPSVGTPLGKAQIAQQYGVLGACYRFRADARVRPFAGLSAGVLRTQVEGQAELPKQGHAADRWSFLAEASLGASVHVHERYAFSLAAHAHVAQPYVAVHFVDDVVATSGRPNLALTLTFGAWL